MVQRNRTRLVRFRIRLHVRHALLAAVTGRRLSVLAVQPFHVTQERDLLRTGSGYGFRIIVNILAVIRATAKLDTVKTVKRNRVVRRTFLLVLAFLVVKHILAGHVHLVIT